MRKNKLQRIHIDYGCLIALSVALSACSEHPESCPLEMQISVVEGDDRASATFNFELSNVGNESAKISTDRLPWNDPSRLDLSLSRDLARSVEIMDPMFSSGLPKTIELDPGELVTGSLSILSMLNGYEKTTASITGSSWAYDFRLVDFDCRITGDFVVGNSLNE